MAPVDKIDHNVIEAQLQDIVQDLYELMVQAAAYDNVGPGVRSKDILQDTINRLHGSLSTLHNTATSPSFPPIRLPPELIQYVDSGRNPDIYTREFVELARRGNQLMKGKEDAFRSFRDVLAREMESALPELRGDVRMVLEATGGVDEGEVGGGENPTGTGVNTGNGVQMEESKDLDVKMED